MAEDWYGANKLLEYLCLRAEVNGIRFGAVKQMLLYEDGTKHFKGQLYINLASRWTVFESRPLSFPLNEEEVSDFETEVEEITKLCSLRHKTIVNAELGTESPHLILTFNDGQVFFMNGHNDKYESWDLGVAFTDESCQIIAMPGDDIVFFTPKSITLK